MSKIKDHIWHSLAPQDVVKILNTDLEKGLTEKEVEMRQKFGRNELPQEKPLSRLRILFDQLKSPLIYILIIAGIITLALKEFTDSIVIFAAVALNVVVGYVQESKASNTLRELKKVLKVKATVFREEQEKEIPQEELVAGDIIILKTGNKVPADGRLIEAWNLKTNEAPLTGEWLAAEKTTKKLIPGTPLADRDNMVYMGTLIEDGGGKAIVTAIGQKTEIGKVAGLIKKTKEDKTPYQKRIARFSKIIGIAITVIAVAIFVEGILAGRNFAEMFITAVAVAVAAIPEGLPVAMTVILALGMQRILKRKGLVRKLVSAETLGSTSIIATDKTLTLTEGKMQLSEVRGGDNKLILKIAVLANEAFVENPQDRPRSWKIRGRPTDRALVSGAAEAGFYQPQLEKEFPKIAEISFNAQNKYIAILRKSRQGKILYVAGAPEKIIERSNRIKGKEGQKKLTQKGVLRLNQELEKMTGKGLRVVALAYKNVQKEELRPEMVKDLIFTGFIGLKDPLRKEVQEAFKICQRAGMRPIIVTGDHLLTAKAVARELGLDIKRESIMLGTELDQLSDQELEKKLKNIHVFARVEPSHKLRIVEAWQKKNQVVAMTGDGINDAAALKKADIGVALGSGTDVAKEVSDLVLLDDNFSVIVAAVEEGRAILDNIRKVITYLLSDSFTEIILIGTAIIAKIPLPISAVQILWVNLLEDGFPNIALAFEPKEKDLMKQAPMNHHISLLTREMKVLIFVIGIFTDLVLLGIFFWLYNQNGASRLDYIRTMIFAALTIDSLFYVFSCKSLRKSLWKINIFSNKFLVAAWAFGILFLLAGIYLPVFQNLLKTVPLGWRDWGILSVLGLINLIAIEGAKYYFIARHETDI